MWTLGIWDVTSSGKGDGLQKEWEESNRIRLLELERGKEEGRGRGKEGKQQEGLLPDQVSGKAAVPRWVRGEGEARHTFKPSKADL